MNGRIIQHVGRPDNEMNITKPEQNTGPILDRLVVHPAIEGDRASYDLGCAFADHPLSERLKLLRGWRTGS